MADAEKLAETIIWAVGIRIAELTPYGRAETIAAAQAGIDETLERAARTAKVGWLTADYNLAGIADADQCAALCEHIEHEIRAMKGQAND